MFRVINDAVPRHVYERYPAHSVNVIDNHDELAIASLFGASADVVPRPQRIFYFVLNAVGLLLIQFLSDKGFHFIANRLAELGFIKTVNFNAFDGVSRIHVRFARFVAALLKKEDHLETIRLIAWQKPGRRHEIRPFALNARNQIIGRSLVKRLAGELVDGVSQFLADFVLVDAGDFSALDYASRINSRLLRSRAEQ